MIKTETKNGTIHTWSDSGFYIHGGFPESNYTEAYDPLDSGRTYAETDKKIEAKDNKDEATVEDYQAALKTVGVLK